MLTIQTRFVGETLPEGHYYKGGIAREALLGYVRELTTPYLTASVSPARDIDIIAVGVNPKSIPHADVEGISSWDAYFDSRDFTINECALDCKGKLYLTRRALRDTLRGVINPSPFEWSIPYPGSSWHPVSGRMISRAFLLAARTGFTPNRVFQNKNVMRDFDIALCTDKAIECQCLEGFLALIGYTLSEADDAAEASGFTPSGFARQIRWIENAY